MKTKTRWFGLLNRNTTPPTIRNMSPNRNSSPSTGPALHPSRLPFPARTRLYSSWLPNGPLARSSVNSYFVSSKSHIPVVSFRKFGTLSFRVATGLYTASSSLCCYYPFFSASRCSNRATTTILSFLLKTSRNHHTHSPVSFSSLISLTHLYIHAYTHR